ncbi:MAG: hypothetical protein CMJ83_10450 [Planctomycetes bacterium]|nr:hypothetical protein [Planctomycetota bacterium]
MRLNKSTRKITFECWPRNVEIGSPSARQYPGWPKTIDQLDNYGRNAVAYLPTVQVSGATNPVLQIVEEATGKWIYSLRIKGTSFRPKVFKAGRYTIRVGEGKGRKEITGVEARSLSQAGVLKVDL